MSSPNLFGGSLDKKEKVLGGAPNRYSKFFACGGLFSVVEVKISSERPEWNFTETGLKPKYGFFIKPEQKLNTETIR